VNRVGFIYILVYLSVYGNRIPMLSHVGARTQIAVARPKSGMRALL
jgi:hypothetical protein